MLYDFAKKSKGYAMDMAITLRKIGNLLRELNNFVGSAEVYKECLDTFIEALVDGGASLKRKLLECEYKKDVDSYHATLDRLDRKKIGRILCLDPEFRATVREIAQLFQEMQCVKFVGQNATSSRRRRRMVRQSDVEKNLKNAVESLSIGEGEATSDSGGNDSGDNDVEIDHRLTTTRSVSCSSAATVVSECETWMRLFWEKEMGRFSRPRPLSRHSITSDEEYAHYKVLSSVIVPAEECLVIALWRFPLPSSVVGDNKYLRDCSSLEKDFEERTGPPSKQATETLSPTSVMRPLLFQDDEVGCAFQDDNLFKISSW
ncbi:hypothetical protein ACHAWF_019058 [Thalassiosira exigua]